MINDQSVFKRYHNDKHFSEIYLQGGVKNQLVEIGNDYYVTLALCICHLCICH